jgi:hypothetical protein
MAEFFIHGMDNDAWLALHDILVAAGRHTEDFEGTKMHTNGKKYLVVEVKHPLMERVYNEMRRNKNLKCKLFQIEDGAQKLRDYRIPKLRSHRPSKKTKQAIKNLERIKKNKLK